MILEQWNCMVGREDPVVQRSLRTGGARCARLRSLPAAGFGVEQRRRRPIQQLFWPELLQFLLHPTQRALSRKFRRAKLSGGKIQSGKTHALSYLCQGSQEIVFVRAQRGICRGTRSNYACYLAPH